MLHFFSWRVSPDWLLMLDEFWAFVFQGLWRGAVRLPGSEGVSERGGGHAVHQADPGGGELPPRQKDRPLWPQGSSTRDHMLLWRHAGDVTEIHLTTFWTLFSRDILSKWRKLVSRSDCAAQDDSALSVRQNELEILLRWWQLWPNVSKQQQNQQLIVLRPDSPVGGRDQLLTRSVTRQFMLFLRVKKQWNQDDSFHLLQIQILPLVFLYFLISW